MVDIAVPGWITDQSGDRARDRTHLMFEGLSRRLLAAGREAGRSAATLLRLQSGLSAASMALAELHVQDPTVRVAEAPAFRFGDLPFRASGRATTAPHAFNRPPSWSANNARSVLAQAFAGAGVGESLDADRPGLRSSPLSAEPNRSLVMNFRKFRVEGQSAFRELRLAADRASRRIVSDFESAFGAGKKFRNLVRDIALDLSGMGLRTFVLRPLEHGTSQALSSLISAVANAFGAVPRRAGGGPVAADRPVLVGEQGPELFVPDERGTIVPSMGTVIQHITVNVAGGINDQGRKTPGQVAGLISRELVRANRRNN